MTQQLKSENQSGQPGNQETSDNLPTAVCERLYLLMNEVTKNEITPETVNSACNCANGIASFVKLNLEMAKLEKQ